FVASVALLANLLLTVGFMVLVNATFTLPGLAGLVLMLGMAVDANVLIYERLREERDRGASLAMAIRNGYDRAFPTIIDTHRPSIDFMRIRYPVFAFTAVISVIGLALFYYRGVVTKECLNIDFTGGTAVTVRLQKPEDISQVRAFFSPERQRQLLAVRDVQQT